MVAQAFRRGIAVARDDRRDNSTMFRIGGLHPVAHPQLQAPIGPQPPA